MRDFGDEAGTKGKELAENPGNRAERDDRMDDDKNTEYTHVMPSQS